MKGQRRIETMFAFIVMDDDNTEGIPSMTLPSGEHFPLLGADMNRIDSLRPFAQKIARELGKKVKLVHFRKREEIEDICP